MRYFISFIFFLLIGSIASAQNYPKAKEFINQVIEERSIVYQDSAGRDVLAMVKEALANNKRHTFYSFKKDSVFYTDSTRILIPMLRSKARAIVSEDMRKTITYVESSVKKTLPATQPTQIVPKPKRSRMFPMVEDSVTFSDQEIAYLYEEIAKFSKHKWDNELLENSKVVPTDTVRKVFADWKLRGWNYLYNKGIHKYYTFSVPIFFRNDTYCLFYYDYGCGDLCGYGELAIYKKENNIWTYWGRISSWIS